MSVNPLTTSMQTSHFSILKKIVILTIVVGLGITLYNEWSTFVATTIGWQKELHIMLASHISAVSDDVIKYGSALIALSFGYGVFHAVGPGHGKAVIVTYLGTNRESVRKGIAISFSGAILQAIIAIGLVSALAKVLKFKLSDVQNYGNDMALVSYILVGLLGVMLVITSIQRLIKRRRSIKNAHSDHSHSHSHEHHSHDHHHHHDEGCGCSHAHVPEENASIWQTLTLILSMGFRPCSGAIVVLIYSHLVGVYFYGVIATLMMGIGTGLSVSLIAIGTLYARTWLERFASDSIEKSVFSGVAFSSYIRLIGGVALIALGWSFYSAASAMSSGHPLF